MSTFWKAGLNRNVRPQNTNAINMFQEKLKCNITICTKILTEVFIEKNFVVEFFLDTFYLNFKFI